MWITNRLNHKNNYKFGAKFNASPPGALSPIG